MIYLSVQNALASRGRETNRSLRQPTSCCQPSLMVHHKQRPFFPQLPPITQERKRTFAQIKSKSSGLIGASSVRHARPDTPQATIALAGVASAKQIAGVLSTTPRLARGVIATYRHRNSCPTVHSKVCSAGTILAGFHRIPVRSEERLELAGAWRAVDVADARQR
jgi:hypothetical protein